MYYAGLGTINHRPAGIATRPEVTMQSQYLRTLAALVMTAAAGAPMTAQEIPMQTTTAAKLEIPSSIKQEHEAIHNLLIEATRQSGRVGLQARMLAEVLHPHFVREEEIALPPLGALATLTRDEYPTDVWKVLAMTDSLRAEMPKMLEEHKRIRAAVDALREAAKLEKAPKYESLADQLALHALTEEQVLYPAAMLVGDLIRARMSVGEARR